jgi:hypothetical protein
MARWRLAIWASRGCLRHFSVLRALIRRLPRSRSAQHAHAGVGSPADEGIGSFIMFQP